MISKYTKNRRRPLSGPDLDKQEPTETSLGTVWGKAREGGLWTLMEEGEVQEAFPSVRLGLPGFERVC